MLEHESGVVTRLTATFYVGPSKQRGLEVHGDEGSLYMPTWAEANSRLEHQRRGGEYVTIPPVREPFPGTDGAGRSSISPTEWRRVARTGLAPSMRPTS